MWWWKIFSLISKRGNEEIKKICENANEFNEKLKRGEQNHIVYKPLFE